MNIETIKNGFNFNKYTDINLFVEALNNEN
jgi:hypothetical protein